MAYQALYRQWRPRNFSQMVGQKAAMDTLRNQVVNGRIAHAYLFCGSRGTGKTSTAKILARAVNCEHPKDGDPCGECPTCKRAENDESLDIIEIDAASNNGVDEMRDLRETVKYPPQYGKYKVYIIDEVHMLSTSAFNALLKTLEEPPAHIVFILATTEPQKLPATILSRCQRFDFGRIRATDIAGRLRQAADGAGAEATDGALMAIARAAEGGMRDALSILDMCLGYGGRVDEALVRQVLGTSDRGFLFQFCEALGQEDARRVFGMIDEMMLSGRDPAVFAREVSGQIRALLTAKCCPEEIGQLMDLTEEDADELRRQGEGFTISRLMRMLDLFMRLETEMRYASTPRLALENTSLKCCLRMEETDGQAVDDRIHELEDKIARLEKQIAEGVPMKADTGRKREEMEANRPAQKATAKEPPAPRKISGDAAAVWKETVQLIKKKEPGALGMVMQGSFAGTEGDIYLWRANPGAEFFADALNAEGRNQKIAGLISEAAGKTCGFRAVKTEAAGRGGDESEDQYVNSLRDTFGAGNVNVVE